MTLLQGWWDKAFERGVSSESIDILTDWGKAEEAAQKLTQIYFEIASEAIGEESVRTIRDERIKSREKDKP